jgi:hypothetical protein
MAKVKLNITDAWVRDVGCGLLLVVVYLVVLFILLMLE